MTLASSRIVVALLWCCLAAAATAQTRDAVALRATHDSLRTALAESPFRRPLVLQSRQSSGDLRGDVYAVVDQPFSVAGPALRGARRWCEVLMLPFNVKSCSTSGQPPSEKLMLSVGRKADSGSLEHYPLDLDYTAAVATADYLRVEMSAVSGPLNTSDYRFVFEITPLDSRRSFLHLSYANAYGASARVALQLYLSTAGRSKRGFSMVGTTEDGQPIYVDGLRGVVERNAMRYYLAIEAYLGALEAPPAEQPEKRLRDWFTATERHALQLHEMPWEEYLAMKRKELLAASRVSSSTIERPPR